MTQENNPEKNDKPQKTTKILIFLVILLGLALAFQTGYLVHMKKTPESVTVPAARSDKERAPQPWPRIPQSAFSSTPSWDDSLDPFRWDPFSEMERMQQQMNRLFHDSFRRANMLMDSDAPASSLFEPDVDIQDKGDHYLVELDLPGMEKDQIQVEVKDRLLTISGERRSDSKQENDGLYRMERHFGSFLRQIPLPRDAASDGVNANYEQGVLAVKIMKSQKADRVEDSMQIPVQ